MNPKVDAYISNMKKWQAEFKALRKMALATGLTEAFKWGKPCYTLENQNVFLIHGFKEYCALLFMKGALLEDSNKVLIQQTEHVQSARQIRFKNLQEIKEMEAIIKVYIENAIEVEKSGAKVAMKKHEAYEVPEELQHKFKESPALKKAFEALTPGRQRGYLFYFAGAKQAKTRVARIEKYTQQILDGKGLNDE